MKKLALVVLLLLVTVVVFYKLSPSGPSAGTSTTVASVSSSGSAPGEAAEGPGTGSGVTTDAGGRLAEGAADRSAEEGEEGFEQPDRPATEIYKDSEEALKAVKAGAVNYDDVILEQFTLLGPDCAWCDQFYGSVRDLVNAGDTPTEQKSYYAELLAISGRVDNVTALVNAIENSPAGEGTEVYSEALEMTVGKDDVVKYLSSKLSSPNQGLKESVVAAISNQGSPLAVETLYRNAVDSGNADGFYSQGTGLGEVIPDEPAYPMLKEMVAKRDDYSHLATKALLNAGVDGLKLVLDTLNGSPDPEKDRAALKDASDHVNYEESTEAILKEQESKSQNPSVVEFAKATLANFSQDAATATEEEQGVDGAGEVIADAPEEEVNMD